MLSISSCQLTDSTLLTSYRTDNGFTDCYYTDIKYELSFEQYIETFYTTPLFKLERFLLKLGVSQPSTDVQAKQLAQGERDSFSAWTVEQREQNQLLMCDLTGSTRSWFQVERIKTSDGPGTRLCFGSAVVAKKDQKTGEYKLGWIFKTLLGFHKLYSIALLYSARRKLLNRA